MAQSTRSLPSAGSIRPPKPAFRNDTANSSPSSSTSLLNPSTSLPRPHPSFARSNHPPSSFHSPYTALRDSSVTSLSSKFTWSADPSEWGTEVSNTFREDDDDIHDPKDLERPLTLDIVSLRGLTNLGCLFIFAVGLVALFAGYPLITHFTGSEIRTLGGYNLGGTNASGQVPEIIGPFSLIDIDTPLSARTKKSPKDGKELKLVFSDEFNTDGRTFYPGDDPFWEAENLHYWQTNNLEWYDPVAITTANGSLQITLTETPTHGLNFQGGLLSSWNKFCFTGGYLEVNVSLPGVPNIKGLWPAIWTLGNLGRAGYGATLEGMWPYTYDSCDVGTLANQTLNGQPAAATVNGDHYNDDRLSYLPGQRLSACTCKEDPTHPGPRKSDGTWTGRGVPEIDVFEATVSTDLVKTGQGEVSQSAQWAPFNEAYIWDNSTANVQYGDSATTFFNTYTGGVTQQATSALSITDQNCYTQGAGCYSIYGFEYKSGYDGYISWVSNNKLAWTIQAAGLGADAGVEISARPVPQEPLYIIMNLGMSKNFGAVDLLDLVFPVSMSVDYVRVYQPADAYNIGCSPADFPTEEYINTFSDAYTNPNYTTLAEYGATFPGNRLIDKCSS